MTAKLLAFLLTGLVIGEVAMAGESSDLTVTMTPLREEYHRGEPIAVVLLAKNTTSKAIQIALDYPQVIGVSFGCKDDGAVAVPTPIMLNRRIPYRTLAPGEDLRLVFALNRYITFTKPGKFTVEYYTSYMGRSVPVDGTKDKYTAPQYESRGKIVINVQDGPIDDQWIKELIGVLQQKEPPATEAAGEPKGKVTKQEAVELLQWAETPLVIEPLIAAAKNEDLPDASADVVKALQKFFKEHERARTGILEIARDRGMGAFQAALALYEEKGVTIPSQWFMPTLKSGETGKIWMSLEYLKKHGKSEDIELVAPLMKSKNEQIAGLAKQVVEELRDK